MDEVTPENQLELKFKSKLKKISGICKNYIGFQRNGMNFLLFYSAAIIIFILNTLSGVKAVQLFRSGEKEMIMSHECLSAVVAFFALTPAKMKLILYFKNRQKAHKLDNYINFCKTLPLDSSDMEREGEKAIYFAVMILIFWSSAGAILFALLNSNFLSLNREETSLLFPIYLPEFLERNSFTFYAVFGIQLLMCTHLVAINGSTLASFAHASNVLCVQNKILGIAICNLTVDHGIRAISNQCKHEKMKQYVEFHSHLVNIVNQLESVFGGIIFWEFVGSQCLSCLLTYQSIVEANKGRIFSSIQTVFMIPALLMTSFIYFFLGTKISGASEELRKLLYFSYWYDQPLWFQKSLLIMMKRMQKGLTFNSVHIIPVNLNSFLKSLQAGFSYFNFLNAMTSR